MNRFSQTEIDTIIKNSEKSANFFVRSSDECIKSICSRVVKETQFLDTVYPKVPFKLRLYHVITNSSSIPNCESCGNPTSYRKDKIDVSSPYNKYCSQNCRSDGKQIIKDKDWLYDQHIRQKKSCERISSELGISPVPVYNALKRLGIEHINHRLTKSEVLALISKKEWWKENYTHSKKSLQELADELGCGHNVMWVYFNRLGIEKKGQIPSSIAELLNNREWIEEQLKTKTLMRIAEELGVSETLPGKYAAKHGIEIDCSISRSQYERDICEWLDSLGVQYISNYILEGTRREVDIYIASCNLGIEFNGSYWHSVKFRDKTYHKDKRNLCLDKGMDLFQIWEPDWIVPRKQTIIKSMLNHRLGITGKRVYARKCELVVLDKKDADMFVDKNHIQGRAKNDNIFYGLVNDNELVSVMCFSRSRFNNSYDYELTRFCNLIGVSVVGGASKLLKAFRRDYEGSIISYAHLDYSNGNLYEKLGFYIVKENKPQHFSVKNGIRFSRFETRKEKLSGLLESYNERDTEIDNLIANGFDVIYDCGNVSYVLDRQ